MRENNTPIFVMNMNFVAWICLLCYGFAALFIGEDQLCDPGNKNVVPYTGFRAYRRYSYGWPVLHHWHIVYCKRGYVDMSAYFLASRNSNFLWNETLCLASERCYRFARRKKYYHRQAPIFVSNSQVGGLYTDTNVPLLPLLAAQSSQEFQFREGTRLVKYVPTLFTPDFTNLKYPHHVDPSGISKWARDLSPTETYLFTSKDRKAVWYRTNTMINRASKLMNINAKYIPWEFDQPSYELTRTRLRDRIRNRNRNRTIWQTDIIQG